MSNGNEAKLQATIDTLNERTAAYDVEIDQLTREKLDLQQLIDEANGRTREAQEALETARNECRDQIAVMNVEHSRQIDALNAQLIHAVAVANAQDQMLAALKQGATGDLAKALNEYDLACAEVQLEQVTQRRDMAKQRAGKK